MRIEKFGKGVAAFETSIPARMDRLPWSNWHWLVVIALGITWVLDGLEVTLAGAVGAVLKESSTLHLTDAQIGLAASFYLGGAVAGALVFGYATDRLGRKRLFTVTLFLYLFATALTALSWNFSAYALFRALTGAGIGGEYAAINSAIDELIPARLRGRVDLIVNSTFWLGAALGSAATIYLLNPNYFAPNRGWRFAFGIGAVLGLGILFLRHFVPESPRWLMIHGRQNEAEKLVQDIEKIIETAKHSPLPPVQETILIHPRHHTRWREIVHEVFQEYRQRSLLGLTLMTGQAFFYNAIFFTYALVLASFYGVPAGRVSLYLLPFALGNILGPVSLGHFFDTIGRKSMIVMTYAVSGILLGLTGWLFQRGALTAMTQTIAWTVIFFVASAAASSAYLTVSEIFPLEIRALAIALFYAAGTLAGGVGAPALFGALIGTGSRTLLFFGYLLGSALMLLAAFAEAHWGVKAERRSLESIAVPLSVRP